VSGLRFDAVLILGKELRRDPERALRELRARSAGAAVALRRTSTSVPACGLPPVPR
jgi:hypothetical protein